MASAAQLPDNSLGDSHHLTCRPSPAASSGQSRIDVRTEKSVDVDNFPLESYPAASRTVREIIVLIISGSSVLRFCKSATDESTDPGAMLI